MLRLQCPMHRCELHEIQEWHRDNGHTDIDNLVAICCKHHKWLEAENLVVTRTPNDYEPDPRRPLSLTPHGAGGSCLTQTARWTKKKPKVASLIPPGSTRQRCGAYSSVWEANTWSKRRELTM